jgi:hypothetical protein
MNRGGGIQMKSKNVIVPEAKFESTFELNIAKKFHQPNWEYQEVMALI